MTTILCYYFFDEKEDLSRWHVFLDSIVRTWNAIGVHPTVIVTNDQRHQVVEDFASQNECVKIVRSQTLVAGNGWTLSVDMCLNLWRYFDTDNVLIVQGDGFALRNWLPEFEGKYDYIGAPAVVMKWKYLTCRLLGFFPMNGGFSLRSRRFCRAVSRFYRIFPTGILSLWKIEDIFYSFVYRLFHPLSGFRFPSYAEACRFAIDTRACPHRHPMETFGIHHTPLSFSKIAHA